MAAVARACMPWLRRAPALAVHGEHCMCTSDLQVGGSVVVVHSLGWAWCQGCLNAAAQAALWDMLRSSISLTVHTPCIHTAGHLHAHVQITSLRHACGVIATLVLNLAGDEGMGAQQAGLVRQVSSAQVRLRS